MRNLVNRHDFAKLGEKLLHGNWSRIARLALPGKRRRVEAAWQHVQGRAAHWWNVPGMQRRWNELVSSDPGCTPREHFVRQHLEGRTGLVGLSLGCGSGERELEWARLGIFERLHAIDLSEPRIAAAREAAERADLADVVYFERGDVLSPAHGGPFDVVIVEQSLHHFSPMATVLASVSARLARGGLFYVDEYVGPSRFQWTDAQLEAANAELSRLPDRFRVQAHDGRVRRRVVRPSILSMRLRDPSEAIESAAIRPGLRSEFELIEESGYGGSLLHLLFENIAHNFTGRDDETREVIARAFAAEDRALASGVLPHDFVAAVCRKRD